MIQITNGNAVYRLKGIHFKTQFARHLSQKLSDQSFKKTHTNKTICDQRIMSQTKKDVQGGIQGVKP